MQFLILSPFAAFALLMALSSAKVALLASFCLSSALLLADWVSGRSLKALQLGAALIFGVLGLYVMLVDGQPGAHWLRLALDVGMLAIGLGSLLLGMPFTEQYAREAVTAEVSALPGFRRTNVLLTAVWTLAFVAMIAADLISVLTAWLPVWGGIAVAFAARNGAAVFTQWYAGFRRRIATAQPALPAAH